MRRVLVVHDDRGDVEALNTVLSTEGYSIQMATDVEGTLHRIKAWKPHLVLVSSTQENPQQTIDFISKIRASSTEEYIAVILLGSENNGSDSSQGIDLGADDFLSRPFRGQEIITRIRTGLRLKDTQDLLKRANHRIEEISTTDDLTGLMNMKTLYRKGQEEVQRARRLGKPFSALLINLDHFSEANHRLGFQAGNNVIQEAGRRIKETMRSIDLVARVGADEFFAVLVETDLANAEFMAERVKDTVQSKPFEKLQLTASIGVAALGDSAEQSLTDLFHFTSEALRSAKRNGTNQIEIYSFA
jgi:two-component system cell cycle response regulator